MLLGMGALKRWAGGVESSHAGPMRRILRKALSQHACLDHIIARRGRTLSPSHVLRTGSGPPSMRADSSNRRMFR